MKHYLHLWLAAAGLMTAGAAPVGEMTLKPNRLEEMVAQLEAAYEKAGARDQLPTLIYQSGIRDLEIEAPLRLGDVRPVDALALIAAAAGCTLEPVHSPEDERVIGYRFEKESAGGGWGGGMGGAGAAGDGQAQGGFGGSEINDDGRLVGIGVALKEDNGRIVVSQVLPGTAAAVNPAVKAGAVISAVANESQEPVQVSGLPLQKVVSLIRGAPGTSVKLTVADNAEPGTPQRVVTLTRQPLQVMAEPTMAPEVKILDMRPSTGQSFSPGAAPYGFGPSTGQPFTALVPTPKPADANQPLVCIYALGSLLNGTENEVAEKQKSLAQLVTEALELSGEAGQQSPQLAFHSKTGALIVKATERQHEVVRQALSALKEHKESPNVLQR